MSSCLKFAATAVISCLLASSLRSEQKLVVHAWGTFTVLQDESGKEIGGINIDDVPVPETLHKISPGSLLPVGAGGETVEEGTRCHSDVTMRLETAVMNFYSGPNPISAYAQASSRAGWLTQFHPAAEVKSPGFTRDHIGSMRLRSDSSSLSWGKIVLYPAPDQAPPTVNAIEEEANPPAARIEVEGEEADGLVYRGVACGYRFPLRVVRDGPALRISEAPLEIPQLWLVEMRADGNVGLRVLHPFDQEMAFVVETAARFAPEEWSPANLEALDALMRAALRRAGLFAGETDALLQTLRRSHAHRIGMRLFFIAPPKSYDFAPSSAEVWMVNENGRRSKIASTSVTVGCIELVTPEERSLLATLAAGGGDEQAVNGEPPNPETLSEDRWQELHEKYDWLGQFRNALLLDEQRRRPTAILEAFIERFHLEGYTPERDWPYRKHTR